MRRLVALALVLVPALAVPAGAAEPRPGLFAGTLGVPVKAKSRAVVRAIDRQSGTLVGSDDVGRSGKFSLKLPAGNYAVASSVIPLKGAVVKQPMVPLTLKPGQRRTKATIKRTKKRKHKRGPRGRAAFVQERGQV